MPDVPSWPAWATANINQLSRTDARNALTSAQAFWRTFALAGLTIEELRLVVEERRRKGPGGRITVPGPKIAPRPKPVLPSPDNSLFDSFPPLDPEDERWMHA